MEPVARTRSSIKVSLLHHLRNLTSLSISAGAHITGGHWTWKGDETLLKKLVAQHGAVIATVAVHGAFMPYKGGIFQGCTNKNTNHAVVVVGYGTENGVDYWLIKVKIFRCNILKCFFRIKCFLGLRHLVFMFSLIFYVLRTPGARGARQATCG